MEKQEEKVLKASHLVFVHGAMHGAWCWYKVRSLLESLGYKVSCLDLKSSGIDLSDPNTISSFEEYNNPLFHFLSNLKDDEKVILVGHSLGGLSLTHSIQEFGNKIHVAVYICAAMLPLCQKQDIPMDIWEKGYAHGVDKPPTSLILKKELQLDLLYHLCPVQDLTLASMLLRPFPAIMLKDVRFNGGGDMDKVKRVFIKTMHDRMMRPEVQDQLIQMWPPSKVLGIESDHSPFFSAPTQLINLLLEAMAHE
ncbi:methylesterase 17-like protein [Cinnamomum micranthum f. kanehirae]|uniref:Methylesterase 17-like protein n=1 Tax=Cinnamomum micranthum f. kanehirae TaxID=337451 RepID=A0A443NPS2_9MAGN|nr:methylesterase 17-like protein [Cinnamomum micranthum f. kanehirae]